MKVITVPFQSKRIARTLGATFNQQSREWEIPDDMDPEIAEFLSNLIDLDENDSFENDTIVENTVESAATEVPDKSKNLVPAKIENDWKQILETDDTLVAAMAIRDYGLPESEQDRATLLKLLGKRRNGDYVISYDSLCGCSDVFASTYPINLITKLVQENVTSQNRYADEIRSSMRLSDEEKALLMFVLPA